MVGSQKSTPIFVNMEEISSTAGDAPKEAIWLAISLADAFRGAFKFDPVVCSEKLCDQKSGKPIQKEDTTPALLVRLQPYISRFFIESPDGNWIPKPNLFRFDDGFLDEL